MGVGYITKALDGSGFFAINEYSGGSTEENLKFSYLDNNGKLQGLVPGRELKDGSFVPYRMLTDKAGGTVFTWDQLVDTLFVVDRQGVYPYYTFDFGEHAFPAEYQKGDFYERVAKFTEKQTVTPYASFLNYFQIKDGDLYFSFFTNENYTWRVPQDGDNTSIWECYRHVVNEHSNEGCGQIASSGEFLIQK